MKLRKLVAILMVLSILMSMPVLNTFAADSFRTETVSDDGSEIDTDSEENSEATPEPSATPEPNASKTEGTESTENDEENSDAPSGASNLPGAAGGMGFTSSKFIDCRGHWAEKIIP